MRPNIGPRPGRALLRAALAGLAGGVLILPAVAPAAEPSGASGAPVPASVLDRSVRFGQPLVVSGRLGATEAGRAIVLELAPSGHTWQPLVAARVASDGSYRLRGLPRSSGELRVRLPGATQTAASGGAAASSTGRSSRPQRVQVAARIATRVRQLQLLSGRAVRISGLLLPGRAGRTVRLQARRDGRWQTLARARSSARGRFSVRLVAHELGSAPVRLSFAGDRANAASAQASGRLEVFRVSTASWYQLTGYALGCGGTMGANQLGVANKTLPCGTMVTFRYGGRSVRVPVIDRGPYVAGREWDLSSATKRALGFPGLGQLWSSR